jgi:hypothetical protein
VEGFVKRSPLVAALIIFLSSAMAAQADTDSIVAHGAVTPEKIGKRLVEIAEQTRKTASHGAARGVIVDLAWPQNDGEYRALKKYIVVLVSVVSQDARELPLKRVYVRTKWRREIVLEKIGSERRDVPKNSPVHWVLGPYREDSFYLVPAGVMMHEGTLLADFAAHRSGFRLYKLPGIPPDFVQADRHSRTAPGAKPDPKALKMLMEREYTGFELPAGLQ